MINTECGLALGIYMKDSKIKNKKHRGLCSIENYFINASGTRWTEKLGDIS